MTVKIGTTRLVLLVSDRAIKIATIRPLRLLFRLITLPFSSRRNRERFSKNTATVFYKRCGTTSRLASMPIVRSISIIQIILATLV